MRADELPKGPFPAALPAPHFPSPAHAVVWRNWGLASPERLARVLEASVDDVRRLAGDLGLPPAPDVDPLWAERGTNTLIRNNWHLLPYEQLLALLDWTPAKLDYELRENDYLFVKLGHLKPDVAAVRVPPPDAALDAAAAAFRGDLRRELPLLADPPADPPFGFLRDYARGHAEPLPEPAPRGRADRGFDFRLAYSYTAPYGDVYLQPELDPYPDGLLARYRDSGVTAVWLPAILYTLAPLPGDDDLSARWPTRRDNLARLADRIRRAGLELILYLNEPHAIPETSSVWARHPDWRGIHYPESGLRGFCTAGTGALAWTREATEAVFRAAPSLGGFFTINMSEFPTHCHSRWRGKECPRCAERPEAEVVAEAASAVVEGARAANPGVRALIYTWAWKPEWELDAIDRLPAGATVLCVSEWGLGFTQAGVDSEVVDYSMAKVGPSERSKALWARARARGLAAMAKVQANACWEMPAVPYLPVPTLVDEHFVNLRREGVTALMLSWTVGGFPGGNWALMEQTPAEWAAELAGPDAAEELLAAWRILGEAYRHFPFSPGGLYFGPHSIGPANLLWLEPTGYRATMVQGFCYDDLEAWRGGVFSEEAYENEWRLLADGWESGLARLKAAAARAKPTPGLEAMCRYAEVAYCHFRSSHRQTEFFRLRPAAAAGDAGARARAREILEGEIELARRLLVCLRADSRVAFECANHYAYTANDLAEKIAHCRWALRAARGCLVAR